MLGFSQNEAYNKHYFTPEKSPKFLQRLRKSTCITNTLQSSFQIEESM